MKNPVTFECRYDEAIDFNKLKWKESLDGTKGVPAETINCTGQSHTLWVVGIAQARKRWNTNGTS